MPTFRSLSANEPLDLNASFSESRRTLKSGKVKTKYKIDVSAKPLISMVNNKQVTGNLAAATALEMADLMKSQLKSAPDAKPETIARRERRFRQWNSGQMTRPLKKRYSGGRTGITPPTLSTKLFQDSGRLANGLAARPRRNSSGVAVITINVPANRFKDETFGTQAHLDRLFEQIKEHVPAIGNPARDPASVRVIRSAAQRSQKLLWAQSKAEMRADLFRAGKAIADIARAFS